MLVERESRTVSGVVDVGEEVLVLICGLERKEQLVIGTDWIE